MVMQAVWKMEILVSVFQGKCPPRRKCPPSDLQEKFKTAAPQVWHAEQPLLSRSAFSNFSGALLLELIVYQRELEKKNFQLKSEVSFSNSIP